MQKGLHNFGNYYKNKFTWDPSIINVEGWELLKIFVDKYKLKEIYLQSL